MSGDDERDYERSNRLVLPRLVRLIALPLLVIVLFLPEITWMRVTALLVIALIVAFAVWKVRGIGPRRKS